MFTMSLTAAAATATDAPTEVFLPEFHFPEGNTVVVVSGGKWEIENQESHGIKVQYLRWWHAEGEQDIKIEGFRRQAGTVVNSAGDDVTYLEQCQQGQCLMM